MEARALDDAISATLLEVDALATQDRAGRDHTAVQARTGYLHDLLRRLASELAGLRNDVASTPVGDDLWRQTVDDLRAREPDTMRAPAVALVSGDLDLLRLVEYTSASIALIQERRTALRQAQQVE